MSHDFYEMAENQLVPLAMVALAVLAWHWGAPSELYMSIGAAGLVQLQRRVPSPPSQTEPTQ